LDRVLTAVGAGAFLLLQTAPVLAAPSPAPSLDKILVAPPGTGFVEQPKSASGSFFEGPFDAAGYAQTTATNPTQIKQSLDEDGFMSGFGRTWLSKAGGNGYVEFVMAFKGAKGAKAWLRQSEVVDKADPNFTDSLTISGIESYYGLRVVDSANKFYAEAFVFVKGNDMLLVSYLSGKNDLATHASTQATLQFQATPEFTIPPAQWPEAKASNRALSPAILVGAFLVGVLMIGLVVAAVLLLQARRRAPQHLVPAYVTPYGAEQVAIAAVQMSDDRRFWWDGAAWRDAEHEVPPAAQRSGDGRFWWDGASWRPVAGAPAGP
jgi:hypothetical protein